MNVHISYSYLVGNINNMVPLMREIILGYLRMSYNTLFTVFVKESLESVIAESDFAIARSKCCYI